jgi:hypothetical protein
VVQRERRLAYNETVTQVNEDELLKILAVALAQLNKAKKEEVSKAVSPPPAFSPPPSNPVEPNPFAAVPPLDPPSSNPFKLRHLNQEDLRLWFLYAMESFSQSDNSRQ